MFYSFWNDLNQAQYDALQNFKEKLLNEKVIQDFSYFDDLYLLRFLRARKFDLTKTHLMFTNFLKWRVDNQVDQIEVLSNIISSIRISTLVNYYKSKLFTLMDIIKQIKWVVLSILS